MGSNVLLGLQWGDEGKGKVVDVLTPKYEIVARFQGGPNAGHTLEFDGIKHVLHTIPSGIFHKKCMNIIGNGVVIDPVVFRKEALALEKYGVDLKKNLKISRKAHLILPTHRLLDAASEASKGKSKIGSTLRGIGPAYMDKTGRNGLRAGDINHPDFKDRYHFLVEKHAQLLNFYNYQYDLAPLEIEWFEGIELLRSLDICDTEYLLNNEMSKGKTILAEGAQGSLLDVDFGSYPFVTSSNTISAGACTGLGIPPNRIKEIFGIFKAYCTRVGSGPFPTELNDAIGEQMRKEGREFGATTGRPRRCGWLDLPALRYAVMINGVTQLIMMKADVLSIFDNIKVCIHYEFNGKTIHDFPSGSDIDHLKPIYRDFKGWNVDLTGMDSEIQIPEALDEYIKFIEDYTGIPITIVSVGPDRKQTLIREKQLS